MFDRLQRSYYWPGMWSSVDDWCRSCNLCQRNKSRNQQASGTMQPLPMPDHCWEHVSHDLITGLPSTARGWDSIAVFVDRLSKHIVLVPTTKTVDADKYAHLFFENVYRRFGLPKVILSDRDPRFTSHFWNSLFSKLGSKLSFSTAFHPQTDGQTERANRTVEDMLRAFIGPRQDDWDLLLPMVEFAYNNSVQASTGFSPFYMNFGRHPHCPLSVAVPLPPSLSPPAKANPAAHSFTEHMRSVVTEG